ncbi:MAG: hypothetical protein PHI34_04235 [Acidobacteriota bacterium]|nr:hypothetical protein [Acidobacteriota bacterium]
MLMVIESSDDAPSQEKPDLIPASGLEDDDSRPKGNRQRPDDPPPARERLIKGMQETRQTAVSDPPPAKPAVRQPAPEPAHDLPPLLTAPGGHDPAFDALRLQEKVIFPGVVVASRGQARGSHTDKAMDDGPSGLRRRKKNHIAGA